MAEEGEVVAEKDEVVEDEVVEDEVEDETVEAIQRVVLEDVWFWHFGELRKMGPGGKVTQTIRAPGV